MRQLAAVIAAQYSKEALRILTDKRQSLDDILKNQTTTLHQGQTT